MKKTTLIVLGILLIAPLSFAGENGEILFKGMGCMSCHHPETTSKINPSLADIAHAYQGKQQQLIGYLNGMEDAIVKPEKAGMMKRHVEKTKALTDQERSALAEFILRY
ncbi:MAG: c-type cytochrome [Deltaproteobacteria bacterium]|nr:c-type cytochrome [Deltaproteobacteria bacterium]